MLSSRSMRLRCRPCAWVALNQVEAEPSQLPGRSPALNRHLRDRGAVQPARELMLDDRPRPDGNFVDDDLPRHNPEDKLFAVLEGQQRPLAGVDCRKADLAGGRIGMELLDGASQTTGETRQPTRHPPGALRREVLTGVRSRADGVRPDLFAGCQKCNRLRVLGQPRLIVLECR